MYTVLPTLGAPLCLFFGLYVVIMSCGLTRASGIFFSMCVLAFGVQATWIFLLPAERIDVTIQLARFGFIFPILLPSLFYHFVVELTGGSRERVLVLTSYGLDVVFIIILFATNRIISGSYVYNFGSYPKAGSLHFLHVFQTFILLSRCALILVTAMVAAEISRKRCMLCLFALWLYSISGLDYAASYGIPIYPIGILFVTASLGILAMKVIIFDANNHEPVEKGHHFE